MSIIGNNLLAGASGGAAGYEIQRSLRFNSGDSAHLARTPSSASNSTTFTWSAWIKVDGSTGTQTLFSATSSGTLQYDFILTSNQLNVYGIETVFVWNKKLSRVFRDPSAWYHLVVAFDTTDSTAEDRIKIYVNGERETDFAINTNPSASRTTGFNKTVEHSIGGRTGYSTGQYFNGYQTEINFIDGSQLGPESFGETDSATGAWIPKQYSGGSYGTNGFYLKFADNSGVTATTLGKDSSGNGNNWTPNNFSVTAGAGNDSLEDTPTNNWCTLNPLIAHSGTAGSYEEGNLRRKNSTNSSFAPGFSSIAVTSGKWYFECSGDTSIYVQVGFVDATEIASVSAGAGFFNPTRGWGYQSNGSIKGNNSSYTDSTPVAASTSGDIIGCAVDFDSGSAEWYVNGTQTGATLNFSSYLATGRAWHLGVAVTNAGTDIVDVNFGQRAFDISSIPTGFKALNTANLPVSTIKDGTEHFDSKLWTGNGTSQTISGLSFQPDWAWLKTRSIGYQHSVYDAVRGASAGRLATDQALAEVDRGANNPSFTSDGITVRNTLNDNVSGQTIVGWFWNGGENSSKTFTVKVVSDSGNKYRFDDFGTSAVTLDLEEGSTYVFDQSDSSNSGHPLRFSTTSDGTHGSGSEYTTGVTTTGTPGSAGAKTTIVVAASAPTLYYYCSVHSGMGGQANTNDTAGASNFAGSIQSTVRVNAEAGFSIVSYIGNATTGATVGHELSVAPNMYIIKDRDSASNWAVFNDNLATNKNLYLNTTDAEFAAGGFAGMGATSSLIQLPTGGTSTVNESAKKYIAYCFSEVEGYSKFGSYTGNGSADGAFVYLGFRPAFVMIKSITIVANWAIIDSTRNEFNLINDQLYANLSNAEYVNYTFGDFTSNGFKIRDNSSGLHGNYNNSGVTYIYMAFAETPFKYANAR